MASAFKPYFRDAMRLPSLVQRTHDIYNQHTHASLSVPDEDVEPLSDIYQELRDRGYLEYATFADFLELVTVLSTCARPIPVFRYNDNTK